MSAQDIATSISAAVVFGALGFLMGRLQLLRTIRKKGFKVTKGKDKGIYHFVRSNPQEQEA